MDAGLRGLLELAFRWVHVIAAILWIGNSMLFNWLDRNLRPRVGAREGSQGEIWLLHSGGFYQVEKTQLVGMGLPRPLHWFKWQAYITWMSGAALLVTVYYLSGDALLAGDSRLGTGALVAIGVGVLVAGWIAYDALWRSPLARSDRTAALLSFALLMGVAYALTRVMSGRAAFLHVGAMLGTLMAANVGDRIMPAQRQLVAAVGEGKPADPALAERAKRRSIHNNYMTYPVIALMLSSHFPGLYGHEHNWLLLGVLVLVGGGVRHAMNIRFAYPLWIPALGATAAAGLAALYFIAARPARDAAPAVEPGPEGEVPFAAAQAVIEKRCAVCHSASPADRTFGVAPGGVAFDTPEQIRALAPRIRERAVVTRTMPPGNATWMTEEEREVLRRAFF